MRGPLMKSVCGNLKVKEALHLCRFFWIWGFCTRGSSLEGQLELKLGVLSRLCFTTSTFQHHNALTRPFHITDHDPTRPIQLRLCFEAMLLHARADRNRRRRYVGLLCRAFFSNLLHDQLYGLLCSFVSLHLCLMKPSKCF